MLITKVLEKGQVVIPKDARDKVQIIPGDKVEIRITKNGVLILPVKKSFTEETKGLIKGKLSMEELENLYAER